jgi:hypothetical protein
MFDGEPEPGCAVGTAECCWRFMALSICSGCAGHWERFCVEPIQETLFVENVVTVENIPYSRWRESVRSSARHAEEPEYRELGDVYQAFPEYHGKSGAFGYGEPSGSEREPLANSVRLKAALEKGGYQLMRFERYGVNRFVVLVVRAAKGARILELGAQFRDWGAALVRANGGRACEIVVTPSGERYQFDRWTGKPGAGGVYVFKDGSFHPWLVP